MTDRPEKVKEKYDAADKYELPYISKSRVKQWLQNKEHFRLKYLEGLEVKETDAMVRGARIHEAIEIYYLNAIEAGQPLVNDMSALPDDRQLWADFIEPYISNFLAWESRRAEYADGADDYLPVGVEEELWRDELLDIDNEPEWMGIADAVLPAAGVPESDDDSGYVIIDFKTGSVPDKRYRDKQIYTELEYYSYLFDDRYDLTGVAAYYPRADEILYQPTPNWDRRQRIARAVADMVEACSNYTGIEKFETNPGPLCKWGMDADDESSLYGVCTQCSWGKPAKNPDVFADLIEDGHSSHAIAEAMGCEMDAVYYWANKMNIDI